MNPNVILLFFFSHLWLVICNKAENKMGVEKKLLYPPAFILEVHDSRSVESSF